MFKIKQKYYFKSTIIGQYMIFSYINYNQHIINKMLTISKNKNMKRLYQNTIVILIIQFLQIYFLPANSIFQALHQAIQASNIICY